MAFLRKKIWHGKKIIENIDAKYSGGRGYCNEAISSYIMGVNHQLLIAGNERL